MFSVVTNPEAINDSRTENMAFFDGGNLTFGDGGYKDVIQNIRLRQRRVIEAIGAEEAILL